jgi:hypothetical protein
MSRLTLELLISCYGRFDLIINRGYLLFALYQYTKFDVCQAKGSLDIKWLVCFYVQFDPWLWLFDLKTKMGHWIFRKYQCFKFNVNQAIRVLKVLSRQYIPRSNTNWPFDLKINRGPFLFITNLHTKYHYNLMKYSHDTEQISCGLLTDISTDQQVQSNMPVFFKGEHNKSKFYPWMVLLHILSL